MFTQATTEENSASVLMPSPDSKMPWRVARAQAIDNGILQVFFLDGLSGKLLFASSFFAGVFEVLKDAALFKQAYVDHGAVMWPGELDLATDAMYAEINANGEWVLR